jgi:hypothetical protein
VAQPSHFTIKRNLNPHFPVNLAEHFLLANAFLAARAQVSKFRIRLMSLVLSQLIFNG